MNPIAIPAAKRSREMKLEIEATKICKLCINRGINEVHSKKMRIALEWGWG